MDTSEHILVILLSTALAVLLVLAIYIAVLAIRLLKVINRISVKAEHIVSSAEHVTETFSNVASSFGPLSVFKVVKNVVELVTKDNSKKGRK